MRRADAGIRGIRRRRRLRLHGGPPCARVRHRGHVRAGPLDREGGRTAEPLREDPGDDGRAPRDRGLHRPRHLDQHHADLLARAVQGGRRGLPARPRAARRRRRRPVEDRLRRVVLRLARGHRGRQAAGRPSEAAGEARDRQREARLPALPGDVPRSALGVPRGEGRDQAALPVGLHLDEEPGVPRRALRRGADRARNRQHGAARDDRGVPGPRRDPRRHRARRRRRRAPAARSARRGRRVVRRRRRDHRSGRRAEVRRLVRPDRREHPNEARHARGRMSSPAEVVERIWARDPSLWTGADEAKWLGWLDEPWRMQEDVDLLLQFADSVVDRVDAIVLLGMGGSSLAPEVIRRAFRQETFHVLDTTHPQAIRTLESRIDVPRTLFISASKSGSTLETRSHTDYFHAKGGIWAAITDPGSELEELARVRSFEAVFPGESTIGGRYSALSPFGMAPAALMGVDVTRLLERAQEMAEGCRLAEGNPGLELGLSLGENWRDGRDKVCIGPSSAGFGLWAEQLIAESTGKHGKGLVPAPDEPPDGPDRQAQEVRLASEYE